MNESFGISIEDAGAPPFEQIRSQLAARVADGSLAVGTRLPPVRALATALGVAANTVARAYRELESAGLVRTAGRAGTTVAAGHDRARARIADAARRYATTARDAGVDPDEALRAVRAAIDATRPG